MKRASLSRRAILLRALTVSAALSALLAATAFAAAPRVDEAQLVALGFKVLVAETSETRFAGNECPAADAIRRSTKERAIET